MLVAYKKKCNIKTALVNFEGISADNLIVFLISFHALLGYVYRIELNEVNTNLKTLHLHYSRNTSMVI